MLFEPCGDLRKDYSAYCETLRLTEREDVYSAVHTSEELEQARVEKLRAAASATGQAHGFGTDHLSGVQSAGRNAHDEMGNSASASASRTHGPLSPSAAGGQQSAATVGAQEKPVKAAGKRNSRAAVAPAVAAVTPAVATGTDAPPEEEEPRFIPRPNLFFLRLRHPGFCINQRDMTPLCRAIPHCPSLVSIELVGCGLSVESYMLLIEAVFKSRRVVAITVDFNNLTRPGFLQDPTVQPAPSSSRRLTSLTAAHDQYGETGVPSGRRGDQTLTPPLSSGSATPRNSSASVASKKKRSTKVSSATAAAEAAAAAAAAAAALEKDRDELGTIYLKPTEFCGLHVLRSPLEDQIQEEREKKGKVDPKKLSLLQQQNDTMNALNVAHRIKVPRSWEGILFTGVRHLCLRGNGITDGVVEKMIAVLLQHPYTQLMTLNLWGNDITDTGASLLAQWLRHKDRRLRALDLGHNHIGDVGLLELADVFRMRELASMEEVAAYRQQVLTRPGATPQERAAASTPLPAAYPSYQELYNAWFVQTYPEAAEEVVAAAAAGAGGGAGSGAGTVTASAGGKAGSGIKESAGSGATPALATATATPASSGAGKRGAAGAGAKNKSIKAVADVLPTLARPTSVFDRHCVRVPMPNGDVLIRVPGNTVLEVLNLCENTGITRHGAAEAVRRLHLHEPVTDAEMRAMAGDSFYAAFPGSHGACGEGREAAAANRTSRLVSLDGGTDTAHTSTTAAEALLTLARPIATGGRHVSIDGDAGGVDSTDGDRHRGSRYSSSTSATQPRSPHHGSLSVSSSRKEKTNRTASLRASSARKISGVDSVNRSTSVTAPGATSAPNPPPVAVPTAAQVTTPELPCADVHLRSFGLFTHRYNGPHQGNLNAARLMGLSPLEGSACLRSSGRHAFDVSTASTAIYSPTGASASSSPPLLACGAAQADWQCFAHLQQSMNEALDSWYARAESANVAASTTSPGAATSEEDGKGKKHGGAPSSSARPGSDKERKAAAS